MFHRFRRASRSALVALAFVALMAPVTATSAPAAAPSPAPAGSPAPNGSAAPEARAPQGAPTVVSVSVSGNTHVPTDRILAVVSTKAGDPFDPAKVQNDLRAISDLGFFADQAPPIIKSRPDGVAVTYRVIENPVVTSIRFEGNKSVSADTLLALMDTASGQVFNIKTYQQDVLKLNSYYDKIGFGGQLPSHVIDVNITPEGVLTLKLQEGLTVRNVIITAPPDADPVLPPTVIKAALVTKPGTPYSEEQRDKDYDAIKALYEKYDLKVGDIEAGVDPASVDQKAGTADVRYSISALRVGAIEITGNTKTHDDVIRRELRMRPGMLVTESGIRRDYERLNNLQFFDKVDIDSKPGPDPKRPGLITLNWQVKEQRTGTATLGAGYSGGITGTGLTGSLAYQENNINGTGNGASVRLERGSRTSDAQVSFTIPYLGKTERSQRYSLGATIFTNQTTNYYPVYLACPQATIAPNGSAPAPSATLCPNAGNIPVAIIPADPTNYSLVQGVVSNYKARSTGLSVTVGRRLTDIFSVSAGTNIQEVASTATLPAGYYFPGATNLVNTTTPGSCTVVGCSNNSASAAINLTAPSVALVDSTRPYRLHSVTLGARVDSRDDIQNPRRGINATLSDEISNKAIGSDFGYSIAILDASRFFPVKRNATLGLHGVVGTSFGAIPTNKFFIFSDQELRGYADPFYGTDKLLGQAELRVPLTADRKLAVVGFLESGAVRIRGATPQNSGGAVGLGNFTFHTDYGLGIRFDVPQLGLRTLRLDFAKGSQGTHTSFGIGQSF